MHPRGEDAATLVELKGEFDLDDVSWRGVVDELIFQGWPRVELDLSAVEFGDSSFLRSLYRLHQHAQDREGGVTIVAASPPVRRLLQITGLDAILAPGLD